MGSPDFGDNDSALGIPMYVIYEDTYDLIDDDEFVIEEYDAGNIAHGHSLRDIAEDLDWDDFENITDVYELTPNQKTELANFLESEYENEIIEFVGELQNDYYDSDIDNIKSDLDDLNSNLDILNVEIVYGYNDGLALMTTCDYVYGNEIHFDDIVYDLDFESEQEARDAFDKEYKLVRDFLKHTAAGLGWKPCHDGWVPKYYEDDWK